jgi:hypothetical protein
MLLSPPPWEAIRSKMLALVLRIRNVRSRVQTSTRKLTPLTGIYVMTKLLRNNHLQICEILSRDSYLALSVIWVYPVLPPPLYNCPICQCLVTCSCNSHIRSCVHAITILLLSETCTVVSRGRESYCSRSLDKLSPHEVRCGSIEIQSRISFLFQQQNKNSQRTKQCCC